VRLQCWCKANAKNTFFAEAKPIFAPHFEKCGAKVVLFSETTKKKVTFLLKSAKKA